MEYGKDELLSKFCWWIELDMKYEKNELLTKSCCSRCYTIIFSRDNGWR